MKRLVRDLIKQKGFHFFTSVTPDTSVREALRILDSKNCSALMVVEDGHLQGVFSEKDFARASLAKSFRLTDKVRSIMTTKIYYVEPTFNLEQCLQVMSMVHVRHLPVMEHGRPIALISMRHIMEVLVEDQETQIRDLMTYITGRSPVEAAQKTASPTRVPVLHSNPSQEAL